jgi:hypothetical protein
MQQVEVANIPDMALWIIAAAQIVLALSVPHCHCPYCHMTALLGQLKEIQADVKDMERELERSYAQHREERGRHGQRRGRYDPQGHNRG